MIPLEWCDSILTWILLNFTSEIGSKMSKNWIASLQRNRLRRCWFRYSSSHLPRPRLERQIHARMCSATNASYIVFLHWRKVINCHACKNYLGRRLAIWEQHLYPIEGFAIMRLIRKRRRSNSYALMTDRTDRPSPFGIGLEATLIDTTWEKDI